MRYLSVCSGIEAASVAWEPLGWKPVGFSEIEPFPCELLAHRFGSNLPGEPLSRNGVPNFGDMERFREWPDVSIDLLCGGTPCQAFSVAGLRKGLDDPRGNLTLTYLALVERTRPEWVVWENVPGVLSSYTGPEPESDLDIGAGWEATETSDFGCFLAGLQSLGYGFSYRILDAQFVRVDGHPRAVPQRRERVFVVGHSSGDPRRAAAVLFEPEGMRGDSPPGREAGQGVAPTISSRPTGGGGLGTDFDCDGGLICANSGDVAYCITASAQNSLDAETETLVAHALRAEGFDASEDGTGRGTPIVPIAFPERMSGTQYGAMEGVSGALGALNPQAVAYAIQERAVSENPSAGPGGIGVQADITYTLAIRGRGESHDLEFRQDGVANAVLTPNGGRAGIGVGAIAQGWAVRRLTPLEYERLQGFPDGWTAINRRNGKPAADGPRYKALGNSMAVNVMRWIGQRIEIARGLK
jgi:DNA (cytosine-5)-methyltransferase 1